MSIVAFYSNNGNKELQNEWENKLKVYNDSNHPHDAQNPQELK